MRTTFLPNALRNLEIELIWAKPWFNPPAFGQKVVLISKKPQKSPRTFSKSPKSGQTNSLKNKKKIVGETNFFFRICASWGSHKIGPKWTSKYWYWEPPNPKIGFSRKSRSRYYFSTSKKVYITIKSTHISRNRYTPTWNLSDYPRWPDFGRFGDFPSARKS